MPGNKEKLIEIAKLVGYRFDEDKLREKIKSYSKYPKMIGIAALFKSNNYSYVDEQSVIKIETPKNGSIVIPKDGFSDGYRLQEAVIDKCRGGKNIIALPALSGVMVGNSNETKWAFKEAWDARTIVSTESMWGGDFLTFADDYLDDDEEFLTVDISAEEFYYNIAMNNRDMIAFKKVNPDFAFVKCDGPCLKKTHYHAVKGRYYGAHVVKPGEEEAGGFGSKGNAPPFYLHKIWNGLEKMNPENTKVVDAAVERAGEVFIPLGEAAAQQPAPRPTVSNRVPRASISSDASDECKVRKRSTRMEGAEALKKFVDDPDVTWDEVLTLYRTPKTAKWANPELVTSSKSAQARNKKQWAAAFNDDILPLLEGDGIHITELLDTIWEADKMDEKIVSNYYMRRLVEGSLNIRETRHGLLYLDE